MKRANDTAQPFALLLVTTLAALLSGCGDGGGAKDPVEPTTQIATVTVTTDTSDLGPGQSTQLVAKAVKAGGQVVSGASFTWLSEAPAVASVDGNGRVTALSSGTAVIAATASNVRGTQTITVRAVASLALTPATADVFVGSSLPLSAQVRDAANAVLTGRTITWTTDNAAVATVSAAGVVKGVSNGSATITAASEGRAAAAKVAVSTRPLSSIIDSLRLVWNMPAMGGAIVTLDNGVTAVAAGGTRRATGGAAVTSDDLWHIGSNVKAMTSLLAAVAVSQGRIQWTTKIEDALPDLGIRDEYVGVTLRELLSHQAGMGSPVPGAFGTGTTAADQRASLVTWALQQQSPQAPRGTFLYSNVGYIVAVAMLERAFGTSYEAAMATHLFTPLGMTAVGWGPQAEAGSTTQPVAHTWTNGAWNAREGYDSPPGSAGAGRAHMSLTSWGRFIQEMLRVEAGASSVATPDVAQQTTTDVISSAGLRYALGWWVSSAPWANGRVVYHDGKNTANESLTYLAPQRKVAFLATTNGFDAGGRSLQALNALIHRLVTFHDTGR